MLKHCSEFLSAKFDNVSSTFLIYNLEQKIFSCQTVLGQWVTLLPRASNHLNKSLTRLKSSLCWNTIYRVFEREIWQRIDHFFRIPPRSKIPSLSDCTRTVTLLPRPSFHLNKSLTRLKSNLRWNTINRVFECEIWQRIEYFFCIHPRSQVLSPSDCTRTAALLHRPSNYLNNSLTRLKSNLCWNTI